MNKTKTPSYDDLYLGPLVQKLNKMSDEFQNHMEISQKSDIYDRLLRLEDSKKDMEQHLIKVLDNLQLLEKKTGELDDIIKNGKRLNASIYDEVEDLKNADVESTVRRELPSTRSLKFSCRSLQSLRSSIVTGLDSSRTDDEIEQDVFGVMMLSPPLSETWFLGVMSFVLQVTLGLLVIFDQIQKEFWETPLNIPITTSSQIVTTQLIVLILAVMTQTDVLIGMRMIFIYPLQNKNCWKDLINSGTDIFGDELRNKYWYLNILLPNTLKIIEGLLILAASFIVIIQSDSVVDLLKDYSALFVISSIDNIFFTMADEGYFGKKFSQKTDEVKEKKLKGYKQDVKGSLHVVFSLMILLMVIPWAFLTYRQGNGYYVKDKFPLCPVTATIDINGKNETFKDLIADGKCQFPYGKGTNSRKCGWDGGDCSAFNNRYPECKVDNPSKLNNGFCDSTEGMYNSIYCGFDEGDCVEQNKKIYNEKLETDQNCIAGYPEKLGDGKCDAENNNLDCEWDAGDCDLFNEIYSNCIVDIPSLIGNGECNDGKYNVEECGWDGGDCIVNDTPNCHVDEPLLIGDGKCHNFAPYNTLECKWDGGDCILPDYPNCHVEYPERIGDKKCSDGDYNTIECGWDGGDCIVDDYPDCHVWFINLGDGQCHGDGYNTEECGWDDGDCLEFNELYPNCKVNCPTCIGNGFCSTRFNTSDCGWDGGDCI